ncbi:hypothetical protein BDV95DRAFT_585959 [Massariosphaeria phaeospora]|uniref:DUF2293 domain-containing protein n=1 Tax=Massariosphaeria phaeospora TaxID=100035 RepID=A0A7C8HZ49_9PLEO|nr:hypothetical protein BDV95DRAFT_585959 [Massariosphaeria phaeospora]
MPLHESTVTPKKPMPKDYAFLPKGIPYKTLHCRRLTHEAGQTVYVVQDGKKTLGIRVPKAIHRHVQSLANETLSARRLATEKRDTALVREAAAELDKQFSDMPNGEREMVLKHGFKKYSGRVGRTGQIPMQRKVFYAVIAHIRHRHTDYDTLLKDGMDRDDARRAIQKRLQDMLRKWGAHGDISWYFDHHDENE